MSEPLTGAACALVRAWTAVYTAGLSPEARQVRREEIESDLWEWQHDAGRARGARGAAHVALRLVLGVPDDLLWRVTHVTHPRATAAGALATLLVGALAWAYVQWLGPQTLPVPPRPMQFVSDRPHPPPPPPPPPPARPPGHD